MQIFKVIYTIFMNILFLLTFQVHALEDGKITYTLHREKKPTKDQSDAYRRIKIAMDSALVHYNRLTSITKNLNVYYNTGVKTADANFNGTIRFGVNRNYMVVHTAMHEIAHTIGVGTTVQYRNLVKDRVFTGYRATAMLREVVGDSKALLHGDSQHFWPYGLNYAGEVKSEQDLINHCKIVNAMYKDMFGEEIFFRKCNLKSVYDGRCINAVDNSNLRLGVCNERVSLVTLISLDNNVYRIEFGSKVLDIPNESRKTGVIAALYSWNGGEHQRAVFEFKEHGGKDEPFSIRMKHSGLYLQQDGDFIVQRTLNKQDDRFYWKMVDKQVVKAQNKKSSYTTGKIEIKIVDGWMQIHATEFFTENININIVDIQGRRIGQNETIGNSSMVFNVASFTRGVYVANVYSGSWTRTRTFFVK